MVELILAFAAGVLTVAAPCILPMLPILLGASIGHASRARPLLIASGFIVAFCGSALFLGALTDAWDIAPEVLRTGAIILLAACGASLIWPHAYERIVQPLQPLIARAGSTAERAGPGGGGALLLGALLGVLWTPCAGPILASILTLIATASEPGRAMLLLACYAIGATLPMMLIAYGGQYITTRVRRLNAYTRRMQQGFGAALVAVALAMHLQYDTVITLWLSDFYPGVALGL